MRIACIATGWYPHYPGGLEKYVYGLTHALLQAGDSVDLFVNGAAQLDDARARTYSIGRIEDPTWRRMLDARRTFAKYFRGPYDVVNIHFALNALPLIPFIDHRIPRVVSFQGPWAAESRAEGDGSLSVAVKAAIERFVYRRADHFIVLSEAFKDALAGYGIRRELVNVIPMGMDCSFFRPADDRAAVRASLGWPADHTVFFTARRLVNRVGLVELLHAVKIVRERHAAFDVKIAGKGPLRGELERTIAALDLADCVELLGFVSEDDLRRCYQAADVTVLPTQSLEGFGTIISESLSCGTPVIVTPVGGMPEAVAPLGHELIARSAAPADIADRLEAVLGHSLSLPDHATCRSYAVEHYDWPIVVERIRTVFAASSG
jgi:glycosyltransferase involved in cell wall biosynthesis